MTDGLAIIGATENMICLSVPYDWLRVDWSGSSAVHDNYSGMKYVLTDYAFTIVKSYNGRVCDGIAVGHHSVWLDFETQEDLVHFKLAVL